MKTKLISSTTLFIIIIHFLAETSSVIIQSYNERCELYDETSSCDSSVGLLCISVGIKGYRCKCPNDAQFGTVYDPKRNKCVGKVWNSCVQTGRGNNIPQHPHNHGRPFNLNETLCVENAECNTQVYHLPICMCKKGYIELDEVGCIPSAKYGQDCDTETAQCDSKYGLSCNSEKKCGCKDETHQFYDHEQEKCVTFVGGNCTRDDECVQTAICGPPSGVFIISGSNGGSAISTASAGGRVIRKRDIFFGSREEIVQNAEAGYYRGPNFNRPPFSPHPQGPFATASASGGIHNGHNKNGQRKCICRSEYSQTKDGFCMPSYGAECKARNLKETSNKEDTNTTFTPTKEICNPDQFLECLGTGEHGHGQSRFRCQCRNPLNERWDRKQQKCVSRPGKRCRISSSYANCESGSECIGGVCQCGNGTSLTPNGNCRLDFNQNCSEGQSECNSWAGLICHGKTQTCLCLDSYLNYDPQRKICVAEKRSPCGYVDQYQTQAETISGNYFPTQRHLAVSKKRNQPPIFINCENGSVCTPQGVRNPSTLANPSDDSVSYTCVANS